MFSHLREGLRVAYGQNLWLPEITLGLGTLWSHWQKKKKTTETCLQLWTDVKFMTYVEDQYLCLLFPLEKAFRCYSRKISGVKTWADRAFPPIFHCCWIIHRSFGDMWKNCEPGANQGHVLGGEKRNEIQHVHVLVMQKGELQLIYCN